MSDEQTPPEEPANPPLPREEGIDPISIETELKRSYLDYAMSVMGVQTTNTPSQC